MRKFLVVMSCLVIAAALLHALTGPSVTPEEARRFNAQREADKLCDKLMSDATLGDERRRTRQMCNDLKERLQKR